MSTAWAWLKRNWKWVLFPVGISLVVGGWYLFWVPKDDEQSVTPDGAADKAVDDIFKATDDRDKSIKELEVKNAKKLERMGDEQKAEFEKLKKGSPQEVAEWIDRL